MFKCAECMPTTTSTNLALPTAAARVVRCPLVSSSPLHSPLSVMSPASAHGQLLYQLLDVFSITPKFETHG